MLRLLRGVGTEKGLCCLRGEREEDVVAELVLGLRGRSTRLTGFDSRSRKDTNNSEKDWKVGE